MTSTPASTANPIFETAASYDSGGMSPSWLAAGDFNADGKLDLAVVNSGSNNVAILLGNGDGTYQPAVTYPTDNNPTYVIVADLNGDGIADLVVGTLSTVDVLLGNGDGTFQAAASYSSGGQDTPSIASGDFNHDGKVDLAIAHACADTNCTNGSVSILLGNGNGTLQAPTSYGSDGQFASSVQVGDFNGDGKLDMAVANASSTGTAVDLVGILLGNGDGTFQTAVSYNAGGYGNSPTVSMAIGDFNGDGKLDLAVADYGDYGVDKYIAPFASVNVLLGNGDGTFQTAVSYDAGSDASSIIAADVNNDGKIDLVVSNDSGVSPNCDCGEGSVTVLLGNGDGTFQPAMGFDATVGGLSVSLVAGDFNRDGKPDLAIANQEFLGNCCTEGSISILLGNADGTFQTTSLFSTLADLADSIVVGDFNGDGKLDMAVGSGCNDMYGCARSVVSVLWGNADGTFQPATIYEYLGGDFEGSSVAVGDFNNDGKLDLVATGTNGQSGSNNLAGVSVLLGNGDGTFQAPVVYSCNGLNANWVGVGDFNGDGKLDLAVAHGCADSSCENGALSILFGNGDGTFQTALTDSSVGQLDNAVIADFNQDGKLDLAMPNVVCPSLSCSTTFIVLLGNGDGTFQPAVTYDTGGLAPLSAVTGDFDADGKTDLAVLNLCNTSNDCTLGKIGILLGNGDGTFQAAVSYSAIANSFGVATGDFNGDGKLDLIISGNNSVSVMPGNGDGSFQAATTYLVGGGGTPAIGDFNRDGKPDLAIPSGGAVSILTNIASGFRYATTTGVTSSANPATVGQSITFTATVTGAVSGPPGGTVTFNDGGNALGTVTLSAGTASFMTTLAAGAHTISTVYSGDSKFLNSSSAAFTETVNATPDFTLSSSALAPSAVLPGQSSTAVVSIAADNGFSGSVTLTCSVTPSTGLAPACSVSPTSIGPGTTATLTVSTDGTTPRSLSSVAGLSYATWLPLLGLALTNLRSGSRQHTKRTLRAVLLGCLLTTALVLSVSCGGNHSSGSGTSGTPAGTYTITVTGTSSGSLQHSTSTTLSVD